MQYYARAYKKDNCDNNIIRMEEYMKSHLYSPMQKDDDFFFFRVPGRLGSGKASDPCHIFLTSRALLHNIRYLLHGVFQIDGTYRLTKNNYPWVICGVVDAHGHFHPICFMISSHEKEEDFVDLLEGLIELSNSLGLVFEPQYVIMDACDASYNAVEKVFPRAKILMCWFHVQFNIRKKCEAKLGDDLWQVLLKDMRGLHYSISTEEYREKTRTFKHYWVKINKDVYTCCESWFFGRHSAWQIFHNPPGYASTNSNIESFNSI